MSLDNDFATFAHDHQQHREAGNGGEPWWTWLMLGGRGAGKTRLGAEWVRALVHRRRPYAEHRYLRIALVGETEHDAREVMVEGKSGLLAISPPSQRPLWLPSRRRLEWPNGAVGETFSADDPDSLRGPQFDAAWCDELAKWRHAQATFDMLQFGLRLGALPRQLITTTPRPIPLIKQLLAHPRAVVTRAGTHANKDHLSGNFLDWVMTRYGGTRLGRQELDGEIIEARADALWSRALIEQCRVRAVPPLRYVVVAIDPPASAGENASACGIVAAGRAEDGTIYVIADHSAHGLHPLAWAARAVALYRGVKADTIIAEINQGGDMVAATIRGVDDKVPVKTVHAMRGKFTRAQPVAAAYAQGKVKHHGAFAELEDEMCDYGNDGLSSGRSPDRLDALVHAVTELLLPPRPEPTWWVRRV